MSGPELIFATAALSALRAVEDGRAVEAGQETSASNAERDAAIAAQRGETNANEARRRGSARQATQRARLAHAGADAAGTPLDLQGQISAEAEFDALRRADAGNLTALNQLTRAQAFRRRGAAVRRAGLFEAGATLLGGLR
ncbi:MAG: hypothetical protein HOL07_11205 [Rhodospirillaceae bacterium]|jgi:hypothetical protein|nr:hypothetical protein [Rhodospirillaceae bacterium]MBT3930458.1 hypothetical protein [Rhodospirillaceae bacterium]MBT4773673.1 hypothetical protein [Rhodospirillaceae bacterium]MBT5358902.1 hypothetical protein [Rhodospirillaceae bacterium]MBT5770153.1 hypothetical protein [Rhodospirillaceae bacterium]